MVERPLPPEFTAIKASYLRHLESGEPPNIKQLMDEASPGGKQYFLNLMVDVYISSRRIGQHPDFSDLQGMIDNFTGTAGRVMGLLIKADPELQQEIFRSEDS